MIVLGIETSCDETAAGIVSGRTKLHANVVSSQAALHARYGGIVPELASRRHLGAIVPVIKAALRDAGAAWRDIDAVAVTYGPGLAGSLLVGVNAAKGIAASLGVPLIGVNHLEGHVCAAWLADNRPPPHDEPGYPLMCLIVSGGHTDLVLMRDDGCFELVGETRDDAAGEAFDKCARILGLGYPGGPEIAKIAKGAPSCPALPRPLMRGTLDFSFSGLKTALLRRAEAVGIHPAAERATGPDAAALARELQEAIVDVLVDKAISAAEEHACSGIVLGGGVAANARLRERLLDESPVPVLIPPPALCTDNGAMIASAAHCRLERGERSGFDLDVDPGLRLG